MRMGEEDNVDRETLRGNTNMYICACVVAPAHNGNTYSSLILMTGLTHNFVLK